MENKVVHLTDAHTSLIARCTQFGEILYWGKGLSQLSADDMISISCAVPIGRTDCKAQGDISEEAGAGSFRKAARAGLRDGRGESRQDA